MKMDQQYVAGIMEQAKNTLAHTIFEQGISTSALRDENRLALHVYARALLLRDFGKLTIDQLAELDELKLRAKEAFENEARIRAEKLVRDDFMEALK